jgi:NAD(P)-dependent dehydrogenase (short-subunit alcohol dehydrogenase family)
MEPNASRQAAVVITGASQGLGLALGCLLAAQRVPVVLTARRGEALERAARTLRDDTEVLAVQADAADEEAMTAAMRQAATLGRLQGFVNNAGWLEPIGPATELELGAFEQHLRTNVTGVLVGMRVALRARAPSVPLRIVNVSSGAAVHAYAGWAAYCASKAAVTMLTQVVAEEQKGHPSTSVVSVAPGIIETAMQKTIRAMDPARFPEQPKFTRLKQDGALLHPVDAAVALDWLVRYAPLHWTGRLVDARADEVLAETGHHRAAITASIARAKAWYDSLEPG